MSHIARLAQKYPFKWPASISLRYWSAKRLALLAGFLLTIIGSVGTQIFVAPYESQSSAFDLEAKDISAKIDVLKTAQAQYILFQQQGALIFAISMAGISGGAVNGAKLTSQLFQLNMLDRTEAVQTIIGSLAMAHRLDYRATFDHYKSLVDAVRKDMSLPNYTAVDDQEKALSRQATDQIGLLQGTLSQIRQIKARADTAADNNRLLLLVAMTLGSTFLLAANLISTREAAPKLPSVRTPAPASDDRVTELSTAAYLIEVALEQARSLGEPKADK